MNKNGYEINVQLKEINTEKLKQFLKPPDEINKKAFLLNYKFYKRLYKNLMKYLIAILILLSSCRPFVIELKYDSPVKFIEVYKPTPTATPGVK